MGQSRKYSRGECLPKDNKEHNWTFHIVQHPRNFHRTWVSLNPEDLCYEKTFMADIPHHMGYFYTSLMHMHMQRGAVSAARGEAAPYACAGSRSPPLCTEVWMGYGLWGTIQISGP